MFVYWYMYKFWIFQWIVFILGCGRVRCLATLNIKDIPWVELFLVAWWAWLASKKHNIYKYIVSKLNYRNQYSWYLPCAKGNPFSYKQGNCKNIWQTIRNYHGYVHDDTNRTLDWMYYNRFVVTTEKSHHRNKIHIAVEILQ